MQTMVTSASCLGPHMHILPPHAPHAAERRNTPLLDCPSQCNVSIVLSNVSWVGFMDPVTCAAFSLQVGCAVLDELI